MHRSKYSASRSQSRSMYVMMLTDERQFQGRQSRALCIQTTVTHTNYLTRTTYIVYTA